MSVIRPASVAGSFYPADPTRAGEHDRRVPGAVARRTEDGPPLALIVPHAGYVYSGPVAASAYARLTPWRGTHHAGGGGRARPTGCPVQRAGSVLCRRFRHSARSRSRSIGRRSDAPRSARRARRRSGTRAGAQHRGAPAVPAANASVTGGRWSRSSPATLRRRWWPRRSTISGASQGTLIVISSDLSHYHDARTARRLDAATATAIVAAEWEHVGAATTPAVWCRCVGHSHSPAATASTSNCSICATRATPPARRTGSWDTGASWCDEHRTTLARGVCPVGERGRAVDLSGRAGTTAVGPRSCGVLRAPLQTTAGRLRHHQTARTPDGLRRARWRPPSHSWSRSPIGRVLLRSTTHASPASGQTTFRISMCPSPCSRHRHHLRWRGTTNWSRPSARVSTAWSSTPTGIAQRSSLPSGTTSRTRRSS